MKYILLLVSMSLAVVGQFLLKKGVILSTLTFNITSIIKTLFSPLILLGFTLYGISSIIWLFILQKFPLSVAYPALSFTYVVIVALSVLLLKEPFTSYKLIGIIFIVFGVFLIFK